MFVIDNQIFKIEKLLNEVQPDQTIRLDKSLALHKDYDLRKFLVEAKVLVDRWNIITKIFVLHPTMSSNISNNSHFCNNSIWGVKIIYSSLIDPNKALAFGSYKGEYKVSLAINTRKYFING